jgi:hypothetical protein
MPNQLMQMMMNQIRARNPQMFQFLEQARKNNNNPMDLFKQVTKNYKPEQIESIFNQARQFGIPDEIINKLK